MITVLAAMTLSSALLWAVASWKAYNAGVSTRDSSWYNAWAQHFRSFSELAGLITCLSYLISLVL